MTTEPMKEVVIEDFSAVDAAIAEGKERDKRQFDANIEEQLAPVKAQADFDAARGEAEIARGVGDRRLRTGGGVMAALVGVAAIVAAASLWHRVEVVHDAVVTERVVTVDRPVVTERVVTVDRPVVAEKVVERPVDRVVERVVEKPAAEPLTPRRVHAQPLADPIDVPAPAPAPMPLPAPQPAVDIPPPVPGQRMSPGDFQARPDFQQADKHGIIQSIQNGQITFTNGKHYWRVDEYERVEPWTTARYNGKPAFCRPTGQAARTLPGKQFHDCFAVVNGRVERVEPDNSPHDLFSDLFN